MIQNLNIKNFKSIKDEHFILGSLNILTGLNGVGKSSVIQALLLLRQNRLNGNLITLGTFDDILCTESDTNDIEINIKYSNDENITNAVIFKKEVGGKTTIEKEISYSPPSQALFSNRFHYLSANRISPALSYPANEDIKERQLGNAGEFSICFIEENRNNSVIKELEHPNAVQKGKPLKYFDQINAWLEEISPNTRIITSYKNDTNSYTLQYKLYNLNTKLWSTYKAINVGFGLTYILPILAAVLSSSPGDLVIIENPEAHLHPKGQSKLGEFLAYAASGGIQLIVETHSDHVINGIRIAVKQNKIASKDISCYFFSRTFSDKKATNVFPVTFDSNGMLYINSSVSDFFEQFDIDLTKILE